jgi:hypothetical protein
MDWRLHWLFAILYPLYRHPPQQLPNPETTMLCLRRRYARLLICTVLASATLPAVAGSTAFPYGSEMMLDTSPIRGSKRVPMIEIEENGTAAIDLWCASLRGQATVGAETITIVPGEAGAAQCTSERQTRDADLLAALSQVTNWRRHGDVIEFIGATNLRFRLMSN